MNNKRIIGPRHSGLYIGKDGKMKTISMSSALNAIKTRNMYEKQRVLVAKIHLGWQKSGLVK